MISHVICASPVYSTEIMANSEEHPLNDTYTVSLSDPKYGDASIRYEEGIEDYMLHVDLKKAGDTVLTITAPTGETTEYDLHIEKDTYKVTKRANGGSNN